MGFASHMAEICVELSTAGGGNQVLTGFKYIIALKKIAEKRMV